MIDEYPNALWEQIPVVLVSDLGVEHLQAMHQLFVSEENKLKYIFFGPGTNTFRADHFRKTTDE